MNWFIPDFVVNPKISTTESRKRANQLQIPEFPSYAHNICDMNTTLKKKEKTPPVHKKVPSFQELEILRNELHFEELQAEARRLDEMRPPAASTKFFKKETRENMVQVKKKKPKKNWVVVSNISYFHPYLANDPI